MDTFAPELLNVPGGTVVHVALVVAPRAIDTVPGLHGRQLLGLLAPKLQL
jgi:hypothetical protein